MRDNRWAVGGRIIRSQGLTDISMTVFDGEVIHQLRVRVPLNHTTVDSRMSTSIVMDSMTEEMERYLS